MEHPYIYTSVVLTIIAVITIAKKIYGNYINMESGRMMLLHSIIIGFILYLVMVFLLKQRQAVAENRSLLIAAFVLIYMILFGHGLPNTINKNLF